jgi:hypothetical protein
MNFAPIKPTEMEALAALARAPATQKAVADAHTRDVAERQARNDRIKALDAQSAIDWPAGQRAVAKAIEGREKAIRALMAADEALRQANSDAFSKSHSYTRSRMEEEAALIAGADLPTVAAWKDELLAELNALGKASVIISSQTTQRNEVTRKIETTGGYSNLKSINARLKAVRASYEDVDLLKLVADQRTLPTIIAATRAGWPIVDQNPGAKA